MNASATGGAGFQQLACERVQARASECAGMRAGAERASWALMGTQVRRGVGCEGRHVVGCGGVCARRRA
eukprot:6214167-Pleurochrysis_carterae.AAC.2